MQLDGKVVLITGGGRGVGRALAETLAKEGSKVAICARTENELKETCSVITKAGGSCRYFVADVTNRKDCDKVVKDVVKAYGRIDILVNNAGWCHKEKAVDEITDSEFIECVASNFNAVFYMCRAVLPPMKNQLSGVVLNITSGAGLAKGRPKLTVYAAAKAATNNFSSSLAGELEGTGVTCFAVAIVGGLNTQMREYILGDAATKPGPEVASDFIKGLLAGNVTEHNGRVVEFKTWEQK